MKTLYAIALVTLSLGSATIANASFASNTRFGKETGTLHNSAVADGARFGDPTGTLRNSAEDARSGWLTGTLR